MDVDALAREIADRLARHDLAVPPFPAYFPRWRECMEARAHAAGARHADEGAAQAPVASVTRVDIGRNEDLDSYLYRVEPGAAALLLIVRGETLAYVASAGGWFDRPDEMRGPMFPPLDLSMMAIWARAEGELGLVPGGQIALNAGGPIHVGFELDRARYESLGNDARAALQDACIPVARDSALLFSGRSGPLAIAFGEPDTPDDVATGMTRPGRERLIAEFDVP
jgi:hypothetical protein